AGDGVDHKYLKGCYPLERDFSRKGRGPEKRTTSSVCCHAAAELCATPLEIRRLPVWQLLRFHRCAARTRAEKEATGLPRDSNQRIEDRWVLGSRRAPYCRANRLRCCGRRRQS